MPGKVLLRDDSLMNLSADIFTEFVMPYEQRCLCAFGGSGNKVGHT